MSKNAWETFQVVTWPDAVVALCPDCGASWTVEKREVPGCPVDFSDWVGVLQWCGFEIRLAERVFSCPLCLGAADV